LAPLPDHQQFARSWRWPQPLPALLDAPRHGLLDVDVLAGVERVERHAMMPMIRCSDDDRVDIFRDSTSWVVAGGQNRALGDLFGVGMMPS